MIVQHQQNPNRYGPGFKGKAKHNKKNWISNKNFASFTFPSNQDFPPDLLKEPIRIQEKRNSSLLVKP